MRYETVADAVAACEAEGLTADVYRRTAEYEGDVVAIVTSVETAGPDQYGHPLFIGTVHETALEMFWRETAEAQH